MNEQPTLVDIRPTAIRLERDGSALLYYGVEPDRIPALRVGGRFGVVYSPSLYSPSFRFWRYVRFEVVMHESSITKRIERGYEAQDCRALVAVEIAHITRLVDDRHKVLRESA